MNELIILLALFTHKQVHIIAKTLRGVIHVPMKWGCFTLWSMVYKQTHTHTHTHT